MELNPNHKTAWEARDNWHKVVALIMVKLGMTELEIELADVKKLEAGNVNIVLDTKAGKFKIRIVDDATAAELARQEGGRACDN